MIYDLAKINYYRNLKNLSVDEFCKEIGVGRSTYWRWNKGVNEPKRKMIEKIAKVLECEIQDIINKETIFVEHKSDFSILENITTEITEIYKNKIREINHKVSELNGSLESLLTLLKGILDNDEILFYVKNSEMNYIIANKAFLKTLNLKINYNIYGKTDKDLFIPEEAGLNMNQDAKVFVSQKALINHEQYICGSRKKRWGAVTKTPLYNEKGKGLGVIGFIIDITAQKQSEVFSKILGQAIGNSEYNIGIREFRSKKFLFVSDNLEKVFGNNYAVTYFRGLKSRLKEKVYKDDFDKVYNALKKFYSKETEQVEIVFRVYATTEQKNRWLKIYLKRFSILRKDYLIRIAKNITNEMEEQVRLKSANDILDDLSGFAILLGEMKDDGLKYTYQNDNVEKLTGYPSSYFYNNENPLMNIMSDESKKIFKDFVHVNDEIYEHDIQLKRADRENLWCRIKMKSFMDNGLKYVSIILRNIDDDKKLIKEFEENGRVEKEKTIKNIAIKLKESNTELNIIAKATGLSIEEIENL